MAINITRKIITYLIRKISNRFKNIRSITPNNIPVSINKITQFCDISDTNFLANLTNFGITQINSLFKLLLPERTENILRLSLRNRLASRCVEIADIRVKLVDSTIKNIALSSRNVTFNNGVSNMLFEQTKFLRTLRISVFNLDLLHKIIKFRITDRQGTQFFRKIKNRIFIFSTLCVCISLAGIRFIEFNDRIIYALRLAHLEERRGTSLNIRGELTERIRGILKIGRRSVRTHLHATDRRITEIRIDTSGFIGDFLSKRGVVFIPILLCHLTLILLFHLILRPHKFFLTTSRTETGSCASDRTETGHNRTDSCGNCRECHNFTVYFSLAKTDVEPRLRGRFHIWHTLSREIAFLQPKYALALALGLISLPRSLRHWRDSLSEETNSPSQNGVILRAAQTESIYAEVFKLPHVQAHSCVSSPRAR